MKSDLGLNAYRFSIEWSRIEPQKGQIVQSEIDHYSRKIDSLLALGITPMITLHHFTHPLWFEELGSFEKKENVGHFVDFSNRIFKAYGDRVEFWATHNEMAPFATMGWGLGQFPPGKSNAKLVCEVLGNLLRSHTQVYHCIKAQDKGDKANVGLVKNIFQFDPWSRFNPADRILAGIIDELYNDGILNALQDGKVKFSFPPFANTQFELPDLPSSLDYIGLNYYSNLLITPRRFLQQKKAFVRPGQIATDFPYSIYAEGLYRALKRVSSLQKPIYITENGIPDNGDERRRIWIERYLYAMKRAIQEGIDVKGYFYWSLVDNFEWAEGLDMRFGLYENNFETQERTLRESAKRFAEIIQKSRR